MGHVLDELQNHFQELEPYLCDSAQLVNDQLDAGKNLIFEGAQGTFLDVDHGTYPYVTSSNTLAEESVLEQELARPKSVTFWGLLKHTQRVLEVVRFQQN